MTFAFDYSIVHLKYPVDIGPRANIVCLPSAKHSGDFLVGKKLTVSGWGDLEYYDYYDPEGDLEYGDYNVPDKLRVIDVKGISNSQCKDMYTKDGRGYWINSENLCAGDIIDGGEDSCQGDSGGRLPY